MNKKNNIILLIIIFILTGYLIIDKFYHNSISNYQDIATIISFILIYIILIILVIKNNLKNKTNKEVLLRKRKRILTNLCLISIFILTPQVIINIFLIDKLTNNIFPLVLLISLIVTTLPIYLYNKRYFTINKRNTKAIHDFEDYILKQTREHFKNKKHNISIVYFNNEKEIDKPFKITNNYRSFIKVDNKKIILIWIDTPFINNYIKLYLLNDEQLDHSLDTLWKEI